MERITRNPTLPILILSLFILGDVSSAHAQLPSFPFNSKPTTARPRQPQGKARQGKQASVDDPDLDALLALPETPSPLEAQVAAAWRQALGQNFQRSPGNQLAALLLRQQFPGVPAPPTLTAPAAPAAQAEPGEPSETAEQSEPAEQGQPQPQAMSPLAAHVISGNWPVVKQVLASLPAEQRSPAYSTLLAVLAGDATGVVLPQDVRALIEASPVPLDDRQLVALGALLRRSLEQSEQPGALLAALKSEELSLTDDAAQQAAAAAKLLLAAGLIDEAKPFLPPLPGSIAEADAPLITLHARYLYLHAKQRHDGEALLQSWQLTLAVLEMRQADALSRAAAMRRALALAPQVPPELSVPWFRSIFRQRSPLGLALVAEIGQQTAQSLQTGDDPGRANGLRLQQLAGTQLLAERTGEGSESSTALEVLTRTWINEAQKGIGGVLRKITMEKDAEIQPLPLKLLLQTAPDDAWRQALAPDTAEHVRHLIGLLAVRTGNEAGALTIAKELVPRSPQLAREVAEALLGSSATDEEEDEDLDSLQAARRRQILAAQRRAMGGWSNQSRSQVVTRAGQLRNLGRLTQLIAAIHAVGVTELGEEALVEAFAKCHSDAEVYLESDIGRVFGPVDQLGADAAQHLAGSLREGLAGQWRDPQLQQQHGTKRTPREQVEEIVRGYALALRILNGAVERSPEHVELRLLLAGVYFDEAEFLYGQQADLATYARERDAAFHQFQAAAEAYSATVAGLNPVQYDVDVYRQWFQAALGASDLSYLTRQDEPDQTQVKRVAAALRSLEPAAAARHQELFAQGVANSLDEVPPPLKPHLVRNALAVIGDQPAAQPLVERLAYYDELLKEVELKLAVDGSDRVGHGLPFGIHVSLLGTRAVARENEAFAALLIPSGPQSPDDADARKRLEQELREKLSEAFTIESFAFHGPQTQPRSTAREGWQELPVAYAVLRAKDPAVDRLPPLQFDLEFADGNSAVRLPVRSQVTAIDCRDAAPPLRPAREVKVRQLLDDRQLAEGALRLEVSATALGIVPELDQLLTSAGQRWPGFAEKRVSVGELSIASLQSDERVEPLTERRWLIELTPAAAGTPPADFEFSPPGDPAYSMAYQRYDDVDIVDAAASTPLHWPALAATRRWLWPAFGLAVVTVVVIVGVAIARRRTNLKPAVATYRLPEQVTPFSVIAMLRRMRNDASLPLSAAERAHLGETLAELDERFFVRGADGDAADLEPICRRWLSVAER